MQDVRRDGGQHRDERVQYVLVNRGKSVLEAGSWFFELLQGDVLDRRMS
jgi:hypothetical protein